MRQKEQTRRAQQSLFEILRLKPFRTEKLALYVELHLTEEIGSLLMTSNAKTCN
jgi:hypothetical protein